MTASTMKTKAEQFLVSELADKIGGLPGSKSLRSEAMERFDRAGFPHRRIEAWKYSDLKNLLVDVAPIAGVQTSSGVGHKEFADALGPFAAIDAQRVVFVDGRLDRALSEIDGVFSIGSVMSALDKSDGEPAGAVADEAIVDLNRALVSDGVSIDVPAGAAVDKPLLIVNLASHLAGAFISLRHRISVGAGASATIIEINVPADASGKGQQNIVTEVAIGEGATVQHLQVGAEGKSRTSLQTSEVVVGSKATYRLFQFAADTALARRQSFVRFIGEEANLDISGLLLGRGHEHCDVTLVIDHAVPGCESREHFKAVLNDEARAVFQAKVIVRQDAQKTDGKQMANALMLSPAAEFDSKPELEIYADDVVCGHGATVAELDEDLLFYLRSRGISESDARALLIESFAVDVLDKVESEPVREALARLANDWLRSGTGGARS